LGLPDTVHPLLGVAIILRMLLRGAARLLVEDFAPEDPDPGGRDKTQADPVALNVYHFHFDVVANHHGLLTQAGKDEHGGSFLGKGRIQLRCPQAISVSRGWAATL
jgi:hypothetical protein